VASTGMPLPRPLSQEFETINRKLDVVNMEDNIYQNGIFAKFSLKININ
jgi:hypothetical protein